MSDHIEVALETRGINGEKTLFGTLIQEGVPARVRREVFAPFSLQWPSEGINILTEHRGKSVAVAFPKRETDGRLTIAIPATLPVLDAMAVNGDRLSIEFKSLKEYRTQGGIRTIENAFLSAGAFVHQPEYDTVTEVRKRKRRWL